MKNLAEQITKLKTQEKEAWSKYSCAVQREVNAMLKRLGYEPVGSSIIFDNLKFRLAKNDFKVVDNEVEVNGFKIPMLVALVRYVRNLPYIVKLHDKWNKLLNSYMDVERVLKQ